MKLAPICFTMIVSFLLTNRSDFFPVTQFARPSVTTADRPDKAGFPLPDIQELGVHNRRFNQIIFAMIVFIGREFSQ